MGDRVGNALVSSPKKAGAVIATDYSVVVTCFFTHGGIWERVSNGRRVDWI